MTKVILGNHTAVYAARSDQDRIRSFYADVLGCETRVKTDEVDRFQMDSVHFVFVYQDAALSADDFQKAIYLELQTDDVEGLRRRIVASGVRTLDIPDPHLYFQAPGGQVFKLVGIDEDLTLYEESTSSTPGAAAAAA
jgi:catechol 2,3-dioxygenase-like lactoylglutathione lyase family enzyme